MCLTTGIWLAEAFDLSTYFVEAAIILVQQYASFLHAHLCFLICLMFNVFLLFLEVYGKELLVSEITIAIKKKCLVIIIFVGRL